MPDKLASPPDRIIPVRKKSSGLAAPAQPVTTGGFWALRKDISAAAMIFWGLAGIATVFASWWLLTWGDPAETRFLSPAVLPSPGETFAVEQLRELWFDRYLLRNTLSSLQRLLLGFGLSALIGVPVGVFCGCFSWIRALLNPLLIFGRNIPVAALIPLTMLMFGYGEQQKTMFLFIASVAFVISDTANAIGDISQRYVDTAYTLGLSRRQIVLKVLFPLALPSIFNSLRLLFGLAFGYIMLAEQIKGPGDYGGIGDIINQSQKRSLREPILLILMLIPIIAVIIDRILFAIQKSLFPYQYGGGGTLNHLVNGALRLGEDMKSLVAPRIAIADFDAQRAATALTPTHSVLDAPASNGAGTSGAISAAPPEGKT